MISWTASKLDMINYCKMRFYLHSVEHEEPIRLSCYARGTLLHGLIENFWDKLGSEEEVAKKSSGKKYSNAQEFGKYAQGLWRRLIISSEHSKQINWTYEGEQWIVDSEIPNICTPLFSYLLSEGKPKFKEKSFKFVVDGREFHGRIDDIRVRDGKVVVRDYKSGRPWIGQMKLNNDPQLTLYNVGLCSLCVSDDKIAESLGMMEERKKFMGKSFFVNPDFVEEFFMIEALGYNAKHNRSLNVLNQTSRREEHFLELLKVIEGAEKALNEGEIYPERGRKCDYCDMKYACEKKLVQNGNLENKVGQELFSFAVPAFARQEKQEFIKKSQKKFRFVIKKH
jgi:hypothetical protein